MGAAARSTNTNVDMIFMILNQQFIANRYCLASRLNVHIVCWPQNLTYPRLHREDFCQSIDISPGFRAVHPSAVDAIDIDRATIIMS